MADRRRIAFWGIPALFAGSLFACSPRPAADGRNLEVLPPRRTLEARLPGLPFGPCPLVGGGIGLRAACPRPSDEESGALSRAGRMLRGSAPDAEGAPSRAERLSALLTARSPADFALGLRRIERHARQAEAAGGPPAAEALTDLAAAYLQRAEMLGDANDYLSAAEAARAALAAAPDEPAALFDLALAYERLLLRQAAVSTWGRLLRVEPSGGWAGEAQAHLARLQGAAGAPAAGGEPRDLEAERELALDVLLPRWAAAAATSPGSPAAAAAAAELAELARRSAAGGDLFLAEVERAAGDPASLAAPLRELAARRAARRAGEALTCAPGLDRLEAALRQEASPLALAALHLAASCAYGEQDFARADGLAARWQEEARRGGFAAAAGRAAWTRGTAASAGGRYAVAESFYREAIGHFERAGEPRNAATLRLLLANTKARAGDPAGAWRQLHAAFGEILAGGDPRRISMATHEAAWQLGLAGRAELGLLYSAETLAEDLASPEAAARCDARFLRCWLLRRGGRQAEAERELALLRAELAAVAEPLARTPFELLALSAEAELYLDSDPRRSARAAAAALEAYQKVAFDLSPLDLHLGLARALRRLGEAAEALAALERGMIYFAAQARENPEIPAKVRLFDRAGKILEEKMELELEQGNDAAAFASLEASRAHLLLDELGAESAGLAAIQQSLEKDDLLIQYLFLTERTLAFRVTRESFSLVELGGARRQLESRVAAWWTAPRGREEKVAEELYDHLLRPLAPAPGERLLISFPDALAALPWAALRDRESGRRAIEDHQILIVPSASAMLAIERRGQALPSLAMAATLAVGDPAFDPRVAPELAPDLPGARDEARAAAAAFPALLLEREQATGSAFLAEMASRPLVLYAGHAVADSREPLATRLFFAPDAAFPTGELLARDFYRRQLPDGALVILSGCETGGGYASPVEGRLDLAHPFLASGAAQVILTRRTVFDRPAQQFLRRFFAALRAGGDPWEAFRAAQIASIAAEKDGQTHHREAPTWAIYQLVGGRWFSSHGGAS